MEAIPGGVGGSERRSTGEVQREGRRGQAGTLVLDSPPGGLHGRVEGSQGEKAVSMRIPLL